MNEPQLPGCIAIRVHLDNVLPLSKRNVLCSPHIHVVFSQICGFCLDLEEGGEGAGDEDKGIEAETERCKGKFATSFFLSVSLSLWSLFHSSKPGGVRR